LLIEGLRAGHWYDPERIVHIMPETRLHQWTVHVSFGADDGLWVSYEDEPAAIVAADQLKVRVGRGLLGLARARLEDPIQ